MNFKNIDFLTFDIDLSRKIKCFKKISGLTLNISKSTNPLNQISIEIDTVLDINNATHSGSFKR